jgi:tetratricopeptide (TPR) repeat protein
MPGPPSRRDRAAWGLLLALACFAVFANGLTGTFTYDDKAIIRDNPRIRAPEDVSRLFTTQYFGGPRGTGTNYRPVLLLSYAAQWWVHGRDAMAFHVVNLLLHVIATLLLGSLFLAAGFGAAETALATLLFALNPVHVEAVTSLVGRGETLAAVFVLGFLHAGIRFAEAGLSFRRRKWLWLLATVLLYALALLTKESAAVAPALLFLVLVYRERGPGAFRQRLKGAFRMSAAVGVASLPVLAGYFAARAWVLGGVFHSPNTGIFIVENPLAPLAPVPRVLNACLVLLRYLGRIVFPLHLSADESAWSILMAGNRSLAAIAAAALLAAILAIALLRIPSRSPVAFGVVFFAIAFLSTSNVFVPFGTIFGERIAYLPSGGICLALGSVLAGGAVGLRDLSPGRRRAAAVLALFFGVRTVTRNAVWWTDSSLFSNSVRVSPGSAKTHYNQGYILAEHGQRRESLEEYSRAVAIYDGYWDAWAGKGRMERELGWLDAAEASYRKALRAFPTYENGYFGLGLVLEAKGRLAEAAAEYRRGFNKNPGSLPLAYRMALALSKQNAPDAGEAWKRALTLGPRSGPVHADHAEWLLRRGDVAEARQEARLALRMAPSSPPALRVLSSRWEDDSLAAALALEKSCRVSGSPEEFAALERIAQRNPNYRERFAAVRASLAEKVARFTPGDSPSSSDAPRGLRPSGGAGGR